jgi:threonine dehydrogenase-like Zn-dependent dehydrogenase
MKAYYLEAPNKIGSVKKKKPPIDSHDVLVRVSNVGICGSDFHLYRGTYSGPFRYPMLFGHEWSGVVETVGPDVTEFKEGDKVTGDCSRFCGRCENCKVDRNLCLEIEKFGITTDGASAEYIARDSKYLYKAADSMSLELLCLAEPMAVAFHLINRLTKQVDQIQEKNILIFGGGAIGISAFMILNKHLACGRVSLFDISKYRSTFARNMGANIPDEETLIPKGDASDYHSMYSRAQYDVIIETTGNAEVITNTLNLTKPLGVIGFAGMTPEVKLHQKVIVLKALTLLGSIGGTGAFPDAIDFINRNSDYVRQLITHKVSAKNMAQAFEMSRNVDKAMKVLLEF